MIRAVLLDALGTLVRLEPPAPLLRRELARRLGLEVDQATAEAAIAAEIAFYRAHLHLGRDAASLRDLRRRSAAVLGAALPEPAPRLGADELVAVLLASLRFTAFADAAPALRALRDRGLGLAVVSNWDVSLHEVLDATGLAPLLDGAVSSAEAGTAKPDPAIFALGLAAAGGAAPAAALHVGDSPEADVAGARAAGIAPVLIARGPRPATDPGVPTIGSLAELPSLCR